MFGFVRTRRAGRAPTTTHDSSESGVARRDRVDRRNMLRLGGMAAAGAAGAAIVSTVNVPSANANPGDPLILGTLNEAEYASTTIVAYNPYALIVSGGDVGVMASGGGGGAGVVGETSAGGYGVVGAGAGRGGIAGVFGTGASFVLGQPPPGGAPEGTGVLGVGVGNGAGVFGYASPTGVAIQAKGSPVPASGRVPVAGNGAALDVVGVATFQRSGAVTLLAAAHAVEVDVPGGLSAASNVLATVQSNTAVGVRSAVPHPLTGKVTIHFNAMAPAGTKVAWFVFG